MAATTFMNLDEDNHDKRITWSPSSVTLIIKAAAQGNFSARYPPQPAQLVDLVCTLGLQSREESFVEAVLIKLVAKIKNEVTAARLSPLLEEHLEHHRNNVGRTRKLYKIRWREHVLTWSTSAWDFYTDGIPHQDAVALGSWIPGPTHELMPITSLCYAALRIMCPALYYDLAINNQSAVVPQHPSRVRELRPTPRAAAAGHHGSDLPPPQRVAQPSVAQHSVAQHSVAHDGVSSQHRSGNTQPNDAPRSSSNLQQGGADAGLVDPVAAQSGLPEQHVTQGGLPQPTPAQPRDTSHQPATAQAPSTSRLGVPRINISQPGLLQTNVPQPSRRVFAPTSAEVSSSSGVANTLPSRPNHGSGSAPAPPPISQPSVLDASGSGPGSAPTAVSSAQRSSTTQSDIAQTVAPPSQQPTHHPSTAPTTATSSHNTKGLDLVETNMECFFTDLQARMEASQRTHTATITNEIQQLRHGLAATSKDLESMRANGGYSYRAASVYPTPGRSQSPYETIESGMQYSARIPSSTARPRNSVSVPRGLADHAARISASRNRDYSLTAHAGSWDDLTADIPDF